MKAINPKNQTIVNRCLKAIERYNQMNDLRDAAEDSGNEREYRKYDRACQEAFDRYLTYMDELPKNQQKEINKIF